MKLSYTSAALFAATARAVSISVSGSGGLAVSPLQYGIMFEDINHSGDGGIYAELIQNRAFQGDSIMPSTLKPWTAVGGASLTLQSTSPALSSALPSSVNVQGDANTAIGISNPGYFGIEVKPQRYNGSFYASGDYTGNFVASLVGASSGTVFASATINSSSVAGSWTKHSFTLDPATQAPDTDNVFELTFTPTDSSQSVNFNLISLFPPTFNDHGLRTDIMNALKAMGPSFLRLPGGNNLEGSSVADRWKWNQTIGDLTQRPGRTGDWGYFNTDGLGLIEYMLWCQDLEMEPILAIWDGLTLGGGIVSQANLQPYVDEAMNELEFLMGDASTTYGKQRIDLGYTEPFQIKYVEVGNEDNINSGQSTYNSYRFSAFYNAIIAQYPEMVVIASTDALSPQPGNCSLDNHQYDTPNALVSNFGQFNSRSTTHTTLIGEYAAYQANNPQNTGVNFTAGGQAFPFWIGAVGEAIFEIGAEKNTDKIIGASYAPLLQNMDGYQWHPDLISFNADTSKTTTSVSYEQIKLFSTNRATTILPTNSSTPFNPLFYVAGINSDTNTYILKAAVYNVTSNATASSSTATGGNVTVDVTFPSTSAGATGELTVLTASDPYDMNVFGEGQVVQTSTSSVTAASDGGFEFELPQWSIALLKVPAS